MQKERRKQLQGERKKIESQLHPNPIVNGCEICHEHLRNGKIRFTAWQGQDPLMNGAQLVFSRQDVLRHTIPCEFYQLHKKDLEWLTTT